MGVSLDVVFYRAVILDRIIFARHTNSVIYIVVHYAKKSENEISVYWAIAVFQLSFLLWIKYGYGI